MTNNINNTKPTSKNTHKQPKLASFDFRSRVVKAWMDMGVSLRAAEVASIDWSSNILIAQKHGLPPTQIANMLYNDLAQVYSTDGEWHYQQTMPPLEEDLERYEQQNKTPL